MKVFTRICIKDWDITAQDGDHFKVKRGKEYTTSGDLEDETCIVFSDYWVPVPTEYFGGTLPLR